MFTGIIEEIGIISNITQGKSVYKLSISATKVLNNLKIGDSVSTNGTCLTVCNIEENIFTVDVMKETLRRTNLQRLKIGSKVNLERALSANGRLDGHIVTGHIDGTGFIKKISKEENAVWIYVGCSKEILNGIVQKGSIAIDGVSLTVAYLDDSCFGVSLIPHTFKNTLFSEQRLGTEVNLECDIIGKYVYKFWENKKSEKTNSINKSFLIENGFM